MNKTTQFYIERANEAANEARSAILDNVRERALRSEAAWLKLAHRANDTDMARAQRQSPLGDPTLLPGSPMPALDVQG